MADIARVGCLLIFLSISNCNGGLPGLSDQDDGNPGPKDGASIQLLGDQVPINKMMVQEPKYKCHQCESPDCLETGSSTELCHDALYCYKSSVRDGDGTVRYSRGCSTRHDHYQLTCWAARAASVRKRHAGQYNVTCCSGHLCNDGEFPELPPVPDAEMEPVSSAGWRIWAACGACLLAVLAIVAALVHHNIARLRLSRAALRKLGSGYTPANTYNAHLTAQYYDESRGSSGTSLGLRCRSLGDTTLRQYLEASASSGSGGGLPLMLQRTLARQVTLTQHIGQGRFGEVWRGLWHADTVAVKIFFSRDEASWRRETEIYSTVLLRHDNILAYIGSDMTSRNGCTQLWLITHYHPLGSLYDQLNRGPVSIAQMMRFCMTITNGLLHLHTEIHGTQGKPAIAHRDIKTKNILVKVNGDCCLADFGLAVTSASVVTDGRQGTKRYMSPEALDGTMDLSCFESYRKCDIYSFALVLWEISWAASKGDYRLPYNGLVTADPGFEDMRKIVCVDGARPPKPSEDPIFSSLYSVMSECWHSTASVRLPALRIKKTLAKICEQHNIAVQL